MKVAPEADGTIVRIYFHKADVLEMLARETEIEIVGGVGVTWDIEKADDVFAMAIKVSD